ncbi:hypothetical protein MHYP_G00100580 [Metynnis hypsauchen]
MLPVGSAILYNTTKMQLSRSVNVILQNSSEVGSESSLFCSIWEYNKLMDGSCSIIAIDSSHSVCSCVYQEITGHRGFTGDKVEVVGHLTVQARDLAFRKKITEAQVVCAMLAGFLHFLFLSSFVWMFTDAILLFISAKNLTKIRSRQKKMLGWKYLTVIGYVVPLVVVGVSVAAVPNGYSSEECWLNNNRGFYWSFLGPVYFILAANVILFIAIFITVTFSLKGLNNEILQRTETQDDKKLIRTVLFKTMAQFFILGCPWILGLSIHSSIVLEIIFVILISQQGTAIFLVHCILNQEVSHHTDNHSRI